MNACRQLLTSAAWTFRGAMRCCAVFCSTAFCLRTISASRRGREMAAHCFVFCNIPSLILAHKCTLSMLVCIYMCMCIYEFICIYVHLSIWVHEHLVQAHSSARNITMWLPPAATNLPHCFLFFVVFFFVFVSMCEYET